MAFTEAQLLTQLQNSGVNPCVRIDRFIPGAVFTDVYLVGHFPSKTKSGPWVQVDSTLTATQAAAAILTAMS